MTKHSPAETQTGLPGAAYGERDNFPPPPVFSFFSEEAESALSEQAAIPPEASLSGPAIVNSPLVAGPDPSLTHPFLLARAELAALTGQGLAAPGASPADLELLRRNLAREYQGQYRELARSQARKPALQNGDARTAAPRANPAGDYGLLEPPRVSLHEELPEARRLYDEAVAYTRRFMSEAVKGRLEISPASSLVNRLLESLNRNPDALMCVSRLSARDVYTYTHCVNVCLLTMLFAKALRVSTRKVRIAGLAGLFHDLGKAFLPLSLLNARRRLSLTEQTLMQRHPMLGCDMLASLPNVPTEMLMAALEHHERYDGSGYPKGLAGDAISEIGHMVGIADTYDALSSRRPYKGAMNPHKSLGVMYQMRRKELHPELMAKFVRLIGVYPVGSVVELKDGYRAVVCASNPETPTRPTIILTLAPDGRPMHRQKCDLSADEAAPVLRCIPAEVSGIDPCEVLGFSN